MKRFRWLTPGLWAVAAILALRLVVVAASAVVTPSNAFVAHYAAARVVVEGGDAARFYDDAWFREQVSRFEPTVEDVFWANPPTMSLLTLPVAWTPYRVARGLWICGSLLLLFGTVAWLMRRLDLRGGWAAAFACLAFVAHPVRENLGHGQVYILALALVTAAWWGYRGPREPLLGTPMGVLLATKTTALMLWPLLLAQRRWRGLGWGAGTAVALVAVSLPFIGAAAWRSYASEVAALPSEPLLAVTAFQTVPSFFRHLMGPGDVRVGAPLFGRPLLAEVATWGCGAALLGASLIAAHRVGRSDTLFAAFVLLGLVLSPVSSEAHYVMALLPIALLAAELPRRGVPAAGASVLALGATLIAADVPFRSPRLMDGLAALLAYPRLYGALLLWGLAMVWSVRVARSVPLDPTRTS
ncbi:MAG TPA: glycosyltransferase family 87 protein [Longimicrobiales bacterium]